MNTDPDLVRSEIVLSASRFQMQSWGCRGVRPEIDYFEFGYRGYYPIKKPAMQNGSKICHAKRFSTLSVGLWVSSEVHSSVGHETRY